jgi:uncharacterized protein
MTKETMKDVIDFLIKWRKPGKTANELSDISISFFGGEPLLNWPVVRYGIEYALEREIKDGIKFSFFILTNGSVWTQEIYDYLKNLRNHLGCRLQMQISIDGCAVSHNKTRLLKNGDGSFAQVVGNAKKYVEIFKSMIVRETLVPEKIDYWIDDYKCLSSISNTVSFTPIVEGDWKAVLKKAPTVINTLFDLYEENLKKDEYQTFSLLNGNIAAKFRETVEYRGCHAGKHLVGISVEGDVYPCHRFLSYKHIFDYKMGDIRNGIDASNPKVQEMLDAHMGNKACNACESYSCNKCYATNMILNKKLVDRPETGYCEFVKIVQTEVDKRSDRVFFNSPWTLAVGNCYKSPNNKRRGIQMAKGKRIFGEDAEDVMVQAMSKCLVALHNIEHQNQVVITLLKAVVGPKAAAKVDAKDEKNTRRTCG